MGQSRIVVLGGGYAGMLAAARAARGGAAQVVLVDQRASFAQRIRMHEALAGGAVAGLAYRPALDRRGVAFVQARAEGLDLARQEVRLAGPAAPGRLGYDILIVALGSATAAGAPGVAEHALRLDDPAAVAGAAAGLRGLAGRGGRALVVGGGLTAVETAAELAARLPGLRVALATGGALGDGFSEAGARHMRAALAGLGVELREGARVVGLEAGRAWVAGGEAIPFDACVWAGGFAAPALLAQAGLAVDGQGRALVGPALQALGRPDVLVAGDSAAAGEPGRSIRMGCVSAMPLGAHAGEVAGALLAGAEPRPFQFGFPGRNVSIGRRDGLVQLTDRRDAPTGRVLTGQAAAAVKELVCRMTLEAVRGELRSGLPLYHWLGGEGWWAAAPAAA